MLTNKKNKKRKSTYKRNSLSQVVMVWAFHSMIRSQKISQFTVLINY